MSLKEDVQQLFDRQHALTRESIRRYEAGIEVADVKVEEKEIQDKLQSILNEGLKGVFEFKEIRIEKDYALVIITNGVFEIPCSVKYWRVGLTDFTRKPGSKQTMRRAAELKMCVTTQQLLGFNRYVVGTSYFEAQEGGITIVICREIRIAA